MAFEKFVPATTGATHVAAAASITDVLMPTVPLVGTTENLLRAAAYGGLGYVIANKKHTGAFFG